MIKVLFYCFAAIEKGYTAQVGKRQNTFPKGRWRCQSVLGIDEALWDFENELPTFSRKNPTHGHALNEYLDLILRDPVPR
jgi:hypothetical protein